MTTSKHIAHLDLLVNLNYAPALRDVVITRNEASIFDLDAKPVFKRAPVAFGKRKVSK